MSVENGHPPTPEQASFAANKAAEQPLRTEVAQLNLSLDELAALGRYTDPETHQADVDMARKDALAQADSARELVVPPRLGGEVSDLSLDVGTPSRAEVRNAGSNIHGLPVETQTTQLLSATKKIDYVGRHRRQETVTPEKSAPVAEREKTVEAKKDLLDIALRTEPRSMKWRLSQEKHYALQQKNIERDIQSGKLRSDSPYVRAVRENIENWERSSKQIPPEERAPNQDRLFVDKERNLFVLADGAGGHKGGARAAQIAIESFALSPAIETNDPERTAAELLISADMARRQMSIEASGDPNLEGMASTVVAAQIIDGNKLVWMAAGDSRIGVFRPGRTDNRLQWLSTEQGTGNIVHNALAAGMGNEEKAPFGESENVKDKDISGVFELEPGDRVFILSDGILGDKPEDRPDISEYNRALSSGTPEEAVDALFEISSKYDDTSAIVFDFNPEGGSPEADFATFSGEIGGFDNSEYKSVSGTLVDPGKKLTAPYLAKDTIPRVSDKFTDDQVEFYNVASQLRLAAEYGGHYTQERERITADLEKALFRSGEASDAAMTEVKGKVDKINTLMGNKRLYEKEAEIMIANAGSRRARKEAERALYGPTELEEDGTKKDGIFEMQEKIDKLAEELLNGKGKRDKLSIKGALAELSGLPAEAWEDHSEDLITDAASELAKGDPEVAKQRAENLKAVLEMSDEEWARQEAELITLRDNTSPSLSDIRNDLREKKVTGNDRQIVDDMRFLRYVLESEITNSGDRPVTPEQYKNTTQEAKQLDEKLRVYIANEGLAPGSLEYRSLYGQLEAAAQGLLAAKELSQDRAVGAAEAQRYRNGNLRKLPRNDEAVQVMEAFNATNEAADAYDAIKAQITDLERKRVGTSRFNPRTAFRLRQLRKEQAILTETLDKAKLPSLLSSSYFARR